MAKSVAFYGFIITLEYIFEVTNNLKMVLDCIKSSGRLSLS